MTLFPVTPPPSDDFIEIPMKRRDSKWAAPDKGGRGDGVQIVWCEGRLTVQRGLGDNGPG